MKKILYTILLAFLAVLPLETRAQSYKIHLDPDILSQFMVMENCAGSLSPATYYKTFHPDYYHAAYGMAKNLYRVPMKAITSDEVPAADSVRKSLENVSLQELKKWQNRQFDLSYQTGDRDKLSEKMHTLATDIIALRRYAGSDGCNSQMVQRYENLYNGYKEQEDMIHAAYMPQGGRKVAYMSLYNTINGTIIEVEKTLEDFRNIHTVDKFVADKGRIRRAHLIDAAEEAIGRWTGVLQTAVPYSGTSE